MGRQYAGILGPLGFATSLARGLVHGGAAEPTLWSAWLALLACSAAGVLIGALAGWIVEDAVRGKLAVEMTAARSSPPVPPGG